MAVVTVMTTAATAATPPIGLENDPPTLG